MRMNRSIDLATVLVALSVFIFTSPVYAVSPATPTLKQVMDAPDDKPENKTENKKPVPVGPADNLDRGTPRSSARGFFNAAKERDYERAAQYMDMRRLPWRIDRTTGPELAQKLSVVLDRTLWVDLEMLSEDPKGHRDDGLSRNLDFIGRIPLGDGNVDIIMQRVPRDDGVFIWKLSSSSVKRIPELYEEHGLGTMGEFLSKYLPPFSFLGLHTWQWVGFVGIIAFAYLVTILPVWFAMRILNRRDTALAKKLASIVSGPLRWLIILLLAREWIDWIHPSVETRALMRASTVTIIVATWALMRSIDLLRDYWAEKLENTGRAHAVVLLGPAANAINVLLLVAATLIWLDNIGFKVSTLLAGLGIGGLAVALAAQKSLENIIGAVTLYAAAPVRVGDFCRFGTNYGTVEEIGLRSTSIRTPDKTVITVPNGEFSSMSLENFAGRDEFRYRPKLHLRFTTTAEQIKIIIAGVEVLLEKHERVAESPRRARFRDFGANGFEVEVLAYVKTTDFSEYVDIAEELNLGIMQIVTDAGAEFAKPIDGLITTAST